MADELATQDARFLCELGPGLVESRRSSCKMATSAARVVIRGTANGGAYLTLRDEARCQLPRLTGASSV